MFFGHAKWPGTNFYISSDIIRIFFYRDTISSSFEGSSERGAILTTHYMEEADALCSRIAIMVNGRMEYVYYVILL